MARCFGDRLFKDEKTSRRKSMPSLRFCSNPGALKERLTSPSEKTSSACSRMRRKRSSKESRGGLIASDDVTHRSHGLARDPCDRTQAGCPTPCRRLPNLCLATSLRIETFVRFAPDIGGQGARIDVAFGMKIIAWSQNMTPEIDEAETCRELRCNEVWQRTASLRLSFLVRANAVRAVVEGPPNLYSR
jgi:hypothetical protein